MLGLFIVGLLNVYLFVNFFNCYLGKEGLWIIVKVVLIGVFMLLCLCGVIFVVIGLRRVGVLKSVIIVFLVLILEMGVDLVLVFYVLLGLFMVVICFIVVVCSVIVVGVLVGKDSEFY